LDHGEYLSRANVIPQLDGDILDLSPDQRKNIDDPGFVRHDLAGQLELSPDRSVPDGVDPDVLHQRIADEKRLCVLFLVHGRTPDDHKQTNHSKRQSCSSHDLILQTSLYSLRSSAPQMLSSARSGADGAGPP